MTSGPRLVTTNWTRIANFNLPHRPAPAAPLAAPRLVARAKPAAPALPRVLRTHRVAA